MDINRGSLDALFTAFKANVLKGAGEASLPVEQLAMVIPSNTAIEKYPVLRLLSKMREWIGPRQIQNVKGEVLSVTNGDYEHTEGIDRNDIEDDQMGLYGPMFEGMGADAANLWGRILFDALIANGDWLDGNAFFYDTRTYGSSTIDNATTGALATATFDAAYLAMQSFCNHAGEPIGVVPDLLVVGPSLRTTAGEILHQGPGATSWSANDGIVDMLVHPKLVGDYAAYWYLLQTKGAAKPFIVQKRKIGALTRMDKDTDACVFEKNENQYGLHYRGAAALAIPHQAYFSTGAA
jgi:phage major head subunit gpT-like protein